MRMRLFQILPMRRMKVSLTHNRKRRMVHRIHQEINMKVCRFHRRKKQMLALHFPQKIKVKVEVMNWILPNWWGILDHTLLWKLKKEDYWQYHQLSCWRCSFYQYSYRSRYKWKHLQILIVYSWDHICKSSSFTCSIC